MGIDDYIAQWGYMIFDTDKGYLHEWKPYGRSDHAAFLRMYLFGACGVGSREVLLLHVARECGVYEIHAGAKEPAKREVIYEVEKLHRKKLVHVPDCACCDGMQYRS